jgi:hypothetical protein
LVLCLLSVGLALAVLLANGIDPLDVLLAYRKVSNRGLREFIGLITLRDTGLLRRLLFVLLPLAAVVARGRVGRKDFTWFLLAGSFIVTALYSMLTNAGIRNSEAPLLVFGVMVLLCQDSYRTLLDRRWLAIYVLGLCVFGLETTRLAYIRHRVSSAGHFFEDEIQAKPLAEPPFFAGLRCGPKFHQMLGELKEIIDRNPGGEIFFGADLEFAYGAFRIPTPRGLPLWWHVGTSFSKDELPLVVRIWQEHRFPTLVFAKDWLFPPAIFPAIIPPEYARDDSLQELTVYRLKDSPRSSSKPDE